MITDKVIWAHAIRYLRVQFLKSYYKKNHSGKKLRQVHQSISIDYRHITYTLVYKDHRTRTTLSYKWTSVFRSGIFLMTITESDSRISHSFVTIFQQHQHMEITFHNSFFILRLVSTTVVQWYSGQR